MADIIIRSFWTNDITKETIEDFRYVVNSVFGPFCTKEHFQLKYINNIYGSSVLILAYSNDMPVGACSLWRNDLEGEEAYLAADACVLPEYQGKGIYSAMLKARTDIAAQRNHPLIYTFPNTNSFPRLIKKKWQVRILRKKIFFPGISNKNDIGIVDKQYALWWLKQCEGICHIKIFGKYYLVKTINKKGVGRILGLVDKETAMNFPKSKSPLWVLYCESEKVTFYNKRLTTTPITYINGNGTHIPFWKMDSL
jgi:GNAT superfamily N-acetyltransferase